MNQATTVRAATSGPTAGQRVLRSRGDAISLRYRNRSLVVVGILALLTVVFVLLELSSGEQPVPLPQVAEVLLGGGSRVDRLVVLEWRLPRALMAVVAGIALAVSGAIFQSLTRNPLGSPDVIGFTSGAYAGAVMAQLVWQGAGPSTPLSALAGGLITAMVVYLLALRRGVQGFRLIIVGIAVSQVLASVTAYVVLRADLEQAMATAVWASGSLNDVDWSQLTRVSLTVALILPLLLAVSRSLKALALGEDAARALGVRVPPTMLLLTVIGVGFSAVVTAYCGLIAFIALAAPQIARRVVRSPGIPLVPSAAMGALMLTAADWLAQHILDRPVPVGVVTVCIGGAYLIHLIVKEARRR